MSGIEFLEVYTDGACTKQGFGGWAYVYKFGEQLVYDSGAETGTTNNRMEMMAVYHALTGISLDVPLRLFSDSKYVVEGLNNWVYGWRLNGWRTADNKPVKNKELWVPLLRASTEREHTLQWVKGHNGHPLNEFADALAVRRSLGIEEG